MNSSKLALLAKRHSVRAYTEAPVEANILNKLKSLVTMVNTHEAGAHFQIITDDPDPFSSFDRNYGIFRNPRNYLACVMDMSFRDAPERAGYFAEQFAIKATELGLGTCFIGGTFNSSKVNVQLRPDWKLLFIVTFGYAADSERLGAKLMTKMVHIRKRTADSFFEGNEKLLKEMKVRFPELSTGLEAIKCAPSSLNKQPVRIRVNDSDRLEIFSVSSNPGNLIDLGIAKFNFAFATDTEIDWGNPAEILFQS